MKITIVSFYSPNDQVAASSRLRRMLSFFESKKWTVHLITPTSKPFGTASPTLLSKALKFFHLSKAILELSFKAIQSDTDLYFVSAPPVSMLIPALFLSVFAHKKLLFIEQRDQLTSHPLLRGSSFKANILFQVVERWLLQRCAGIIVPTPGVKENLNLYWPELKNKTHVVWNGFWKEDYLNLPSIELNKNSQRLEILHSGHFYGTRDPIFLIPILKSLKNKYGLNVLTEKLQFVFMGLFDNETKKNAFFNAAEENQLSAIFKLKPMVSPKENLILQRQADVLLLITQTSGSEMAMPAKFFEYLASEKPILAITHDPVLVQAFQKHDLGWCIPHENTKELEQVFEKFLTNPDEIRKKRTPGLNARDFDAYTQLMKLEELLKNTISVKTAGVP